MLGGRERYLEDQWAYFREDLGAKDGEGWTDMELVGVDDAGDFCSIKVSVFWVYYIYFTTKSYFS